MRKQELKHRKWALINQQGLSPNEAENRIRALEKAQDQVKRFDKLIRMNKPLKQVEEQLLRQTLYKDGFTNPEIDKYIERVKEQVKFSHEIEKKRLIKEKPKFKDSFRELARRKE